MLLQLSHFKLRSFEGKVYPFGIMYFSLGDRKKCYVKFFMTTFLFSASQVSTLSLLPLCRQFPFYWLFVYFIFYKYEVFVAVVFNFC